MSDLFIVLFVACICIDSVTSFSANRQIITFPTQNFTYKNRLHLYCSGSGSSSSSSSSDNSNAVPILSKGDCCNNKQDDCTPAAVSIPSLLVKSLAGAPLAEEISDENIIKIVNLHATDTECNHLCWKCLGYRYNEHTQVFESSEHVFPKWLLKYPKPPDVIGVLRDYRQEVDKDVRNASMDLMRSIPRDYKGGVRSLEAVGFKGYKLKELTPNKTRRAQLCNWLIYYREKLHGKTIQQLHEEKELELSMKKNIDADAMLPSEVMYQKLRLD